MMTALIKMEQIEKGCVTMELYNYQPQPPFVLKLAIHRDRAIGEEGGADRMNTAFSPLQAQKGRSDLK